MPDEVPSGATLLHVLNGDATRSKLEASDVPGRLVVWADALHDGAVPGDLSRPDWLEVRARFIADAGYATLEEARATLAQWEVGLESHSDHREVVLWLEHDLFDQLLLLHHLDWFAERRRPDTRLSLICVGEYPGVADFKGLGQLAPDQLASLLGTRRTVTARQLELGRAGWRAFTAPDPRGLESFLAGDTTDLPFLAPALRRLLEEYPSTRDGLSLTERRILELVVEGSRPAVEVFHALHAAEAAFYIADLSFWRVITELAAGADPLVRIADGREGDPSAENPLRGRRIASTDSGRAVLAGAGAVRLRGIDRWIGGVQLRGREAAWCWDPEAGRLRGAGERGA